MKVHLSPLNLASIGLLVALAGLLPVAQAAGNAPSPAWSDPAFPFRAYLPLTLHQEPSIPAWRYHVAGLILGRADAGGCGFQGRILDASGAPQQGVQVQVWADSGPSHTSASDGEGRWQVQVASAPVDALWHLAVVDGSGGFISPVADVPTYADARNGHQWYTVNWQEMTTVPEYVVASARRLACLENKGNHNLYIKVYDRLGRGVDGLWLRNAWQGGYDDRITY
ncbi:MAG: carboxypeptidase-like regulatory domain-containing protein, partial [Anaerolineae bacterium]